MIKEYVQLAFDEYLRKRDFRKTPEPKGRVGASHVALRFVVQKHHASHLHFDLRLEYEGVLKSWAVPRGPSLDPNVKRLAVEVEDHPLEYSDFEGVIPAGEYGAGRVLVWDRGIWQPEGDPAAMFRTGKLKFRLQGHRLRGEWALVRTKPKGKQQQWLLSKRNDEEARTDIDVLQQYPGSILTAVDAKQLPEFIPPKLPSWTDRPPPGDPWFHELKLDGYRMQAQWREDEFRLMTRSGHDWTERYADVADQLSKLDMQGTILDGELVALDGTGKSDFDTLARASSDRDVVLAYFAFDLLYWKGVDFRQRPLLERKIELKRLVAGAKVTRLQYLDHVSGGVEALVQQCRTLGLEGIVSKRSDRGYSSGRAKDWLKTKFRFRESLVVVGYELSGKTLGSLLVAYFDEKNELQFAGRVGTGWKEREAKGIVERLAKLTTQKPGLSKPPSGSRRHRDHDVERFWIQPVVVADVDFSMWTDENQLRHASLMGFNDEVSPRDVTAEALFADRSRDRSWEDVSVSVDAESAVPADNALPGLTNPDRILYPQDGITKRDVAAYLYQVSRWLLPQITARPVSLLRCSQGIDGEHFFQRHPGKGFPREISTLKVASEDEPLLTINNLQALLATAQISTIELHPWGCRNANTDNPDRLIVDLDPDEGLGWNVVVEAAFIVRAKLEAHGLQSFVKTTGGKGLHVVVPSTGPQTWEKVFQFTKSLATDLAKSHNKLFVANMAKSRRRGRIFLDYHRNRRGSTAVAAYSLRARPGAPVSTPLSWDELPGIHPLDFTLRSLPTRLSKLESDPWTEIGSLDQSIGD